MGLAGVLFMATDEQAATREVLNQLAGLREIVNESEARIDREVAVLTQVKEHLARLEEQVAGGGRKEDA